MIYLAMFIIGIGCLVVGASLAARRLAHEHDEVERLRTELDRDRADIQRQAALLREALHLEAPDSSVAFDLGAQKRTVVS